MRNVQDKMFILFLTLLTGYIIYLLSPVLTPFLTGAILAYLANPLVNKLVSFRISRTLSVVIVFVLFFAAIILLCLLLVPVIEKQIHLLIESIPKIITYVQATIMPWLKEHFSFVHLEEATVNIDAIKSMLIENTSKATGAVNWLLKTTLSSGVRFLEWMINLILIPVVTFYLLCDWNKFLKGIRNLLPRRIEPTVVALMKECDQVLHAFFRGQFLVMISLAVVYSIGLSIIGLQIGVLIGIISGLLSIVPYLGSIIGIIIASIAMYVQDGSFTSVLLVWLVFAIGHVLDNALLTPRLVGDRIGLHPVAVIFAILAGGSLFGFVGVLLALPVASFIMVWIRYLNKQYLKSNLYKA